MIEHMEPGNYWLVTASGNKRKAVVVDRWTLLIHQETMWDGSDWLGDRWWQPPLEVVQDSNWSFVPRIEDE
jgi:hypothetical protein